MKYLNLESVANYFEISKLYIEVIVAFGLSFILTFVAIPKIIRVSYRKHLMDVPGSRSSHSTKVPRLGGVALFFAISIVASVFSSELLYQVLFLSAAIILLFFIGLMDDLLVVAPHKKLYAQILSATLIVVGSDIRIGNFVGLFGFYEIPYLLSVLISIFIIVLIINSYNLIDGIDGLASGVGGLISLCFVFIFFRLYDYTTGFLAIAVLAALLAFSYYNLSKEYKIFMGDTGSMVIGLLIAFMVIKFINLSGLDWVMIKNAPVVSIAILIVPLIDTLSVIIIRLWSRKSPFFPDQNHIHHRLLRLGFNHLQTTVIICFSNISIIVFAYFIRHLNINLMFILVVFASLFLSYLPLVLGEKINHKNRINNLN
ncbi:MAG TPA: MraY family glycosyltransferase [Flavobacterium sp.]|nr:MraY family glycosyltransferase [Flavobacterium sp.]